MTQKEIAKKYKVSQQKVSLVYVKYKKQGSISSGEYNFLDKEVAAVTKVEKMLK